METTESVSAPFHPLLPATSTDRDRNRKRAEREGREGGKEGKKEKGRQGWKDGRAGGGAVDPESDFLPTVWDQGLPRGPHAPQ